MQLENEDYTKKKKKKMRQQNIMLENTKVLYSLKSAKVTAMGKWCIVNGIGSLTYAAKYLNNTSSQLMII
jgi:hypothetical protein